MSEHYKGHIIDVKVYELADSSGWTAEISIYRKSSDNDTMFFLPKRYETCEEATAIGTAAGKRIVDEGYEERVIVEDTVIPET